MANTFSLLSYANTFGDWVVATNSLIKENNDLASNTYIKGSGTLYLNDPSLGLQVANASIFAGPLQVSGIGSSLYVQNGVVVDKQLILSNTSQTIVANGQANISGTIYATSPNIGLLVSNNAIVDGTTTLNNKVTINANTNIANTIFVSGTANLLSDLFVSSNTNIFKSLNVIEDIYSKNHDVQDSVNVKNNVTIKKNLTVGDNVVANTFQANNSINTSTISVSTTTFTNNLQANNRVSTSLLTVSNAAYANTFQANNSINTSTISVSTTTFTNNLQANTRVNAQTLTVTGTAYANVIQANTAANVSSISVSNDIFTKNIQANNVVQTQTLNTIGTAYVNSIIANTSLSTPQATVTNFLYANNASAFFSSIQTSGQFVVGGNFVLQGASTYNSNSFTLNANSSTGLISTYGVNRGTSGVNAIIRWNEPSKYWDILDVQGNSYYKILTSDLISSSTTLSSSSNIASSLAVSSSNTWLQSNDAATLLTSTTYTNSSNTKLKSYTDGAITSSNTQLKSYTDGAITSANTQLKSYTDGVVSSANTQLKSYVDGYISYNNSLNTAQNTSIVSANTQLKSYVDASDSALSSIISSAWNRANTSPNLFFGTSSSVAPLNGVISLTSTNGVTIVGSSNTFTINTPQDVRTSASPTFSSLSLSSPLAFSQGGTGATSQAQALTNLLPTGTSAGYVLTTGGPGTFYWAAGGTGGGGGTTPGTTINSSRLFPTVNVGQTVFATPKYLPGASQLRVYINGVRQFNSEYTETSNSSVTLTTGCSSGDVVLLEVDGYIVTPYYANTIAFTAPFGSIVSTANTIQLAIQDLETRKATLTSPALTGTPTAPTAALTTTSTQIATTAFANTLITTGVTNAQLRTIGVGTAPDKANVGSILATGYIVANYSDESLKNKLGNIENALDKLMTLDGFYYEPNETAQELGYVVKREVGVSAQQVEKVMPEVVSPAPIDNKYLTVNYERLVPLLIESIKELKKEIDLLKNSI